VRFLNKEFELLGLVPLENKIIDTVELTKIMYPTAPSYKLNNLAAFFNLEHDDPHRALSDTYVTAELFIRLLNKIAHLPKETVNHLLKLEPAFHSDLRHLFIQSNQGDHQPKDAEFISFDGLIFNNIFESGHRISKLNASFGHLLDDI